MICIVRHLTLQSSARTKGHTKNTNDPSFRAVPYSAAHSSPSDPALPIRRSSCSCATCSSIDANDLLNASLNPELQFKSRLFTQSKTPEAVSGAESGGRHDA